MGVGASGVLSVLSGVSLLVSVGSAAGCGSSPSGAGAEPDALAGVQISTSAAASAAKIAARLGSDVQPWSELQFKVNTTWSR